MNTNPIATYRFRGLPNITKGYADLSFHTTGNMPHYHEDYYELILVIRGTLEHTIGNTTTHLESGTLLLCRPGVTHHFAAQSDESRYFTLCIEQSYFEKRMTCMFPDFVPKNVLGFLSKTVTPEKLKYMEQLGSGMKTEKETLIMADRFLFLSLSDFMYYSETLDCNVYVSDIIQKLNNDAYLTVSVDEICSGYPYSHSMLLRQFKELTGMTIAEYKVKQKMKYACRLLSETDTKIVDIATALQYDSLSYFFQTFKKHIGVTPAQYRKGQRAPS